MGMISPYMRGNHMKIGLLTVYVSLAAGSASIQSDWNFSEPALQAHDPAVIGTGRIGRNFNDHLNPVRIGTRLDRCRTGILSDFPPLFLNLIKLTYHNNNSRGNYKEENQVKGVITIQGAIIKKKIKQLLNSKVKKKNMININNPTMHNCFRFRRLKGGLIGRTPEISLHVQNTVEIEPAFFLRFTKTVIGAKMLER